MAQTDPAETNRPRRPGPRQARALETRRRLLVAGRDAFTRLGHDGVNLARDILEPAGVSVGSFYHQFNDKTDLLLEVMAEAARARRGAVIGTVPGNGSVSSAEALAVPRHDDDIEDWLAAAFDAFFDSLDDDEHAWRLQLDERSSRDERVRRMVNEGRDVWVRGLTTVFVDRFDASAEAGRRAATMLVAHAMGLAALHLDRPEDRTGRGRAHHRHELTAAGVVFGAAGIRAVLSGDDPGR